MKFEKRIILHIVISSIVYFLFFVLVKDIPLVSDSLGYHQQSFTLISQNIDDYYWPPLIPIYLNIIHSIFNDSEISSRIAMSFLYFFFLVFMSQYLLKENKKINSIIFGIVSINPFTLLAFSQPDTQSPMMLLLVLVLYFTQNFKSNFLNSFIVGLVLGLCVLMRASSIVLIIPFTLYFIINKIELKYIVSIILPFLIIIVTWIAYVLFLTNSFVYINTANSMNLFLGNNKYVLTTNSSSTRGVKSGLEKEYQELCDSLKKLDYKTRDKAYRTLTFSYLTNEKSHFMQRTFFRFINFFNFNTLATGYIQSNFRYLPFTTIVFIFESSFSILIWFAFFSTIVLKWKSFFNYKDENSLYLLLCTASILIYAAPHFITLSHPTYANGLLPLIISIPFLGGIFDSFSSFRGYFKNNKLPIIFLTFILIINNLFWLISMIKYL